MNRENLRLSGYALTPVHVGDGSTLSPDGYRLARSGNRDVVERFDPPAVLAAMPEAARQGYLAALSRGGLRQAREMVAKAVQAGDVRERIGITPASLGELRPAFESLTRSGDIRPFVRSGGLPFVPGSTVKGALRTAWLAAMAATHKDRVTGFRDSTQLEARPGRTGPDSDRFQQALFDYRKSETETDPMRDVSVSDAGISADATLIDRVQVANRQGEGPVALGPEGKMQMHYERLAAVLDRGDWPAARLSLTLGLPTREGLSARLRLLNGRSGVVPKASSAAAALRAAVNFHHAPLWVDEIATFYRGTATEAELGQMLAVLDLPTDPRALAETLTERGLWLLRLGRFSHFESKTVKGYRHGQKRGKQGNRDTFIKTGGSRTVAKGPGGALLPFGWVLLWPEDQCPAQPPQLARSAPPRTSPMGAAPPRPTAGLIFRKGDKVTDGQDDAVVLEDVREGAHEMRLDIYGDHDTHPVEDWKLK